MNLRQKRQHHPFYCHTFARQNLFHTFPVLLKEGKRWEPDCCVMYMRVGIVMKKKKFTSTALNLFERAEKSDPENTDCLYLLGRSYAVAKQPLKGISYLERVIKIKPTHIPSLSTLGKLYLATNNYKEAIETLGSVHRLLNTEDSYILYIGTLLRAGEYERVLQETKYTAFSCDEVTVFSALAYKHLGDTKRAISILRVLYDSNPTDAYLSSALKEMYEDAGEYHKVLDMVKFELERDPSSVTALYSAGLVCNQMQDYEAAISYLLPLSKLKITGKDLILSNLGFAYLGLRKYTEAHQYLYESLNLNSGNPFTWVYIGKLLVALKEYSKAEKVFALAERLNYPDMTVVKQYQEDIKKKLGDNQI